MRVSRITGSAALVRVVPFAVFLGLTFFQDKLGETGPFWVYLAKTVVGAGMIWAARPFIQEMRWQWSWEAVACGLSVFVLWVGIDSLYPKLDELLHRAGLGKLGSAAAPTVAWNPHSVFGSGTAAAWFFVLARLAGSSLIVPPIEEVFFRSFLYRYLVKADFQVVPLSSFRLTPFLLTALLFGLEHNQWLAGILCGLIYQGLVCLKGRLGDAITAHALTNFLLGLWVIGRGAWNFW